MYFCLFIVFSLIFSQPVTAETAFQQGEKLFLENNPRAAAPVLESALAQEPRNEKIYLYLGIVYEQLANYDKAIGLMKRGLDFALLYKDLLLYNIANNYLQKGENENALRMYTEAVAANGSLSDAYLNRANLQVKMDKLAPAVSDYEVYLNLEPNSPQRPEIERMIRLIRNIQNERETKRIEDEMRKKEEEEKRIADEARRKQEEEQRLALEEKQRKEAEEKQRIAEEKKRQEEAARQKALLESVLNSLKASTEGTTNLSAEKENIREKREEVDIDG